MASSTPEFEEVCDGLSFPEGGPIYLRDGSVILVEIRAGLLVRVFPDGRSKVALADLGGGPNSSAVGPDGAIYITQSGGLGPYAEGWTHGAIQRVDPVSGEVSTLYTSGEAIDGSGQVGLQAPNDLVFDAHGGFYFTDLGKEYTRTADVTGIFYAQIDGSACTEVILKGGWPAGIGGPLNKPNGIALSPDGTKLYACETPTGRLWSWDVIGPGQLKQLTVTSVTRGTTTSAPEATLVYASPDSYGFDSMAVDGDGNICVATLGDGSLGAGGITVVRPDGSRHSFLTFGDTFTTNIAFGGADGRDAYITLSGSGRLVKMRWHCAGHRCHYEDLLDPARVIGGGSPKL